MRLRVSLFFLSLCLALSCVLAPAQIRVAHTPQSSKNSDAADPDASPLVKLALCVHGSSVYPCPADVGEDTIYIPAITYTYGQILDGAATFPQMPLDGYVTISANGNVFCTLYANTRTPCPPQSTIFDAGTYTLVLLYTDPDDGSTLTGAPVVVTVLQDTSSINLQSSRNPAPLGTPVTFTVSVLGGFGEPATGQVVFTVDDVAADTTTLDATGAASFTTSSLAIGVHQIEASYAGSNDFLAATTDPQLAETITPPGTATTLTSSVNPSAPGQSVTFTAAVTSVAAGVHPSGAVSFNDGTKTFATVLVSAQGVAPTNISTLASGTHNITANYSGDAATSPSVSPILVQQVGYPLTQANGDFIVTVTPSPVVLGVGLTANLTVQVTSRGSFSEPVTLTCGTLPHESTCTFGQSVIPAGGGTTTLDLHVTSPHDCGSTSPYFYGANRPGFGGLMQNGLRYGAPAMAGALLLLVPRKRRWHTGLLAFCVAMELAGLSGCSSACTDFGTYPGSYTFQVIGTAPAATGSASTGGGTPLTVQTSVGLTVKL